MRPRVSVVIPAYNEGAEIDDCLDRILEAVTLPCEVLVVYDTPEDTTAPYAREYALRDPRVRPLLNTEGRGPAAALRFGIQHVRADVTVVTMADGSDDPMQIDQLTASSRGAWWWPPRPATCAVDSRSGARGSRDTSRARRVGRCTSSRASAHMTPPTRSRRTPPISSVTLASPPTPASSWASR
jgi:glycosyltransferase involved in cell wall biosynthesis